MKVLIHTLVWKRPEVTKLAYRGFDRIQRILKDHGISSEVLITSSEQEHNKIAKDKGYHVFETENFPIATKYNNAMIHTLDHKWDYLMEMGSNNLLSDRYVEEWIKAAKFGEEIFGLRNFIALHSNHETVTRFYTSKPYKISNLGRGVRRDLWEKLGQTGKFVHRLDANKDLDGMSNRMAGRSKIQAISYKEFDAALDVKTDVDMHHHSNNSEKADIEYLISIFPELKYWL